MTQEELGKKSVSDLLQWFRTFAIQLEQTPMKDKDKSKVCFRRLEEIETELERRCKPMADKKKWKVFDNNDFPYCECPVCQAAYTFVETPHVFDKWLWCPECGAQFNGIEETEQPS